MVLRPAGYGQYMKITHSTVFDNVLRGVAFPIGRPALIEAAAANGADASALRILQDTPVNVFRSAREVEAILEQGAR